MMLPKVFIDWAYFGRVKVLRNQLSRGFTQDPMFFIDMMRHTPILATASIIDGRIFVNAKVVGAGFILKENYIDEALVKLRKHYLRGEDMDRLNYAMGGLSCYWRYCILMMKLKHMKRWISLR